MAINEIIYTTTTGARNSEQILVGRKTNRGVNIPKAKATRSWMRPRTTIQHQIHS